jgi:pyridoxamine 5'-phosphate oxidase family protein
MSTSKKFRNILENTNVAFVVDDILPPWIPRAIEIRGTAEALPTGGKAIFGENYTQDEAIIRIKPTRIISWGLDGNSYTSSSRKVS